MQGPHHCLRLHLSLQLEHDGDDSPFQGLLCHVIMSAAKAKLHTVQGHMHAILGLVGLGATRELLRLSEVQ